MTTQKSLPSFIQDFFFKDAKKPGPLGSQPNSARQMKRQIINPVFTLVYEHLDLLKT